MQLTTTLLWAIPATFLGVAFFDPGGRYYVIEPILAPAKIAGAFQDGDGIAASLRTEVSYLARDAQSGVAIQPTVPGGLGTQIRISGTEFTLDNVRTLVRVALNRQDVRVSGEMTALDEPKRDARTLCVDTRSGRTIAAVDPGPFRLVLKDNARGLLFDCTGGYDDLLRQGAYAVFARADPFAAATLQMKVDGARNFDTARLGVEAARAQGDSAVNLFRFWPLNCAVLPNFDVARAHLTLGAIYNARGRFTEALGAFERANHEHRRMNCLGRDWSAAKDGVALVHLSKARQPAAQADPAAKIALARQGHDAARDALGWDPFFENAMFHRAEALDILFGDGTSEPVACRSAGTFTDAIEAYERLIASHPRSAIGRVNYADLVTRRLRRLNEGASALDACPAGTEGSEQGVRDLLAKAVGNVVSLTALEPDVDHSSVAFWQQMATASFDRAAGGRRTSLCPASDEDWFALLGEAVGQLATAVERKPEDGALRSALDRAAAARLLRTPKPDGSESTALRAIAVTMPDGADRQLLERLAGDLAACRTRMVEKRP